MWFMPPSKAKPSTYQLKITLLEIEPPIWRRIQVPNTLLLCCLHDAIQAVMGWTDSHLHQFEDDIEIIDESEVPVGKVLLTEGDSMVYVYDFVDDWRHQVVLEKILPSEGATKPVCLAGEQRCPPADVRGPFAYEHFLGAILT